MNRTLGRSARAVIVTSANAAKSSRNAEQSLFMERKEWEPRLKIHRERQSQHARLDGSEPHDLAGRS
jgi:hypothetical protein